MQTYEYYQVILSKLLYYIDKETRHIIKQVNKCLNILKSPTLPLEQINALINSCITALKVSDALKKALLEDAKETGADCDEDQKAEYEEEYESYNDVVQSKF